MSILSEDEPQIDEPQKPIVFGEGVLLLENTKVDDKFFVNDDLMIKIMVTSKKDIKNDLIKNWRNINRLTAHPSLGKVAMLLVDGHPLVAGNKVLIVEYPLDKAVTKVNSQENQQEIQDVISNIFGRKMFVYAVSRKDSIRLQKMYMDMIQVNKLPKINESTLKFIGE